MSSQSTYQPHPSDPEATLPPQGGQTPVQTTGYLPTYRPEVTLPSGADRETRFRVGEKIGDYELLQKLGEGAFGQVFLARQLSLDRPVAVKVTANRGSEARTLASLAHDHIVQVYAELVDPQRDLRVLCMQYVPGTTLAKIIAARSALPVEQWSGRAILDALDSLTTHPAVFHPAALRDREMLAQSDHIEAVCWYGARLAEALDYAHSCGILHRDVKPANILVNRYGRPLLADFNLAIQTEPGRSGDTIYGGTLAYMAPEHLDAFNPKVPTTWDAVDARSDLYSLGVVIYELATGRRPFPSELQGSDTGAALVQLAEQRRTGPPPLRQYHPDLPDWLERILRRCLAADPRERFASGAELAKALDSGRELHRIHRHLPPPGRLTRLILQRPFVWFVVLLLLPHFLGSIVNIAYNQAEIVSGLDVAQKRSFQWLTLVYNLTMYPLCLGLMCRLVFPVMHVWRKLLAGQPIAAAVVDEARRRVLVWPLWAVALSCLGWLPGGLLFPLGIQADAGPLPAEAFGHFLVSFTISGLIALTYSYFAVQYVALRAIYPRLWAEPVDVADTIRHETAPIGCRLRIFQVLAGAIPLLAAVLLVGLTDAALDRWFRLLLAFLILVGMVGFGVSVVVQAHLARTLAALVSPRVPAAA